MASKQMYLASAFGVAFLLWHTVLRCASRVQEPLQVVRNTLCAQ